MAKKRTSTFKFSTTISITLVLFMVSVFGWLTINLDSFTDRIKEEIQLEVFFYSSISNTNQLKIEKFISSKSEVKSVNYISKEEGLKLIDEEVGRNVEEILGYIPINPSLVVNFYSENTTSAFLNEFKQSILSAFPEEIEDVTFVEQEVETIKAISTKLSLIVLAIVSMLLIITIVLINNTIRLSIHSKRFIIRTMLLVGAKGRFIRKPFLIEALYQGVLSSILAIVMFLGLGLAIIEFAPSLFSGGEQLGYKNTIFLFGSVIFLGIMLSCLTTYFALIKFLKLRTDKLYN